MSMPTQQPEPMRRFAERLQELVFRYFATYDDVTSAGVHRGLGSRTTIWQKLNGEAPVTLDFVECLVSVCQTRTSEKLDVAGWSREFERMWTDSIRLRKAKRFVTVAHEYFRLTGQAVSSEVLPEAIVASWLLLGPDATFTVHHEGEPNLDTPLVYYGRPIIDHAIAAWGGSPISVVLANPGGTVCLRRASDKTLERNDRLAPGMNYSEEFVLTNGIGRAKATCRTAYVKGRQHLADELQGDVCAATVIRDPSGKVGGIVDITRSMGDEGYQIGGADGFLLMSVRLLAANISEAWRRGTAAM